MGPDKTCVEAKLDQYNCRHLGPARKLEGPVDVGREASRVKVNLARYNQIAKLSTLGLVRQSMSRMAARFKLISNVFTPGITYGISTVPTVFSLTSLTSCPSIGGKVASGVEWG